MATDYRRIVDYGRFLRSFVSEPGTTLVRQEDLAYCASRLLLLAQYVRREDKTLAELIEASLRDLAALNPESAIRRVRQGRTLWESSPVYWALCCHVLAQTLSEFSKETSTSTIGELRSSLAEWFPRFRHAIESKGAGNEERQLVCLQCYLTQCAIFHDMQALVWATDKIMTLLTPERMQSEVALESAALLAGVLSRGESMSGRSQLAFLFDRAAEQSESAREARNQISDIVPSHPNHVIPSASQTSVPRMQTGAAAKQKKRGPKRQRGVLGKSGEAIAPFITPLILIAIVGGCVWGMGKWFDWFENTSHVGQQSLGDWYRNSDKAREEAEQQNAQLMAQVAPGILAAAEIPANEQPVTGVEMPVEEQPVAPTPTPAPVDPAAALQAKIEKDVKSLKSRIGVPRQIALNGQAINVHGEFTGSNDLSVSPPPNDHSAHASYAIKWFVNGQEHSLQSIEAKYAWDGKAWNLTAAARSTSPPGTPQNQKVYVQDPADRKWAADLFVENPFY